MLTGQILDLVFIFEGFRAISTASTLYSFFLFTSVEGMTLSVISLFSHDSYSSPP